MGNEKTTKTIYTISVKFAKEGKRDLILDKTKETRYENIIDKEIAIRLMEFLETQILVPKDYPIPYFSLKAEEIDDDKYQKLPIGRGPSGVILESITENGETEEEFIHEMREGHFVRRLYLCDVIKNWDYEEFYNVRR